MNHQGKLKTIQCFMGDHIQKYRMFRHELFKKEIFFNVPKKLLNIDF